jgi:DNA mismatch repair protein MutS2
MRVFTDLFVEMGDDQSIENDLSSFSSHLTNLKEILLSANSTSLVLIDEIGSGTDPAEGASIAAAALEHLTQINAFTIVTTHHGVLKSFAYETPGMINCAMEFDQATLTPTYRLRVGVPGSSYAIEMAERLRLPGPILERAKLLRGTESMKLERLIEDLERRNQELASNLVHVNDEKAKFNSLNLLYESKLSSLKEELKTVKSKALDEAQTIVDKANVAIEKAVREIKEQEASSSVIRTVRANIREIDNELQHMKEEFGASSAGRHAFAVGDLVKLKDADSSGEIVSQLDKDHYVVLAGDMRLKVKASELVPASKAGKSRKPLPSVEYVREGRSEIDLRGMYGQEAISAVEKFFDEAILSGVTKVNLIHGKGTGALRRKIDEYLKNHPSIKSFRLGEWNEGGSGVTVVELS